MSWLELRHEFLHLSSWRLVGATTDSTLEAEARLMVAIVHRPARFEHALLAHRVRAVGELLPAVRFAERHVTFAQTTPLCLCNTSSGAAVNTLALTLRGHGCEGWLRC